MYNNAENDYSNYEMCVNMKNNVTLKDIAAAAESVRRWCRWC